MARRKPIRFCCEICNPATQLTTPEISLPSDPHRVGCLPGTPEPLVRVAPQPNLSPSSRLIENVLVRTGTTRMKIHSLLGTVRIFLLAAAPLALLCTFPLHAQPQPPASPGAPPVPPPQEQISLNGASAIQPASPAPVDIPL